MKYIKTFEGLMNTKLDEDKFAILNVSTEEFKSMLLKAVKYAHENRSLFTSGDNTPIITNISGWSLYDMDDSYTDNVHSTHRVYVRDIEEDRIIAVTHKKLNVLKGVYRYSIFFMIYDSSNELYGMEFMCNDHGEDILAVDYYIKEWGIDKFLKFLYYIVKCVMGGRYNTTCHEKYGILFSTVHPFIYKYGVALSYMDIVKLYNSLVDLINNISSTCFISYPEDIKYVKEFIDKKGMI